MPGNFIFKTLVRKLPPIRRLIDERDSLRAALGVDNVYGTEAFVQAAILAGDHRRIVGGGWEHVGAAQLECLRSHGLLPDHHLLDIGCGTLRGGLHLIPYLEPGNYWGVDTSRHLLDAGWERELVPAGLDVRRPRSQLVQIEDFDLARIDQQFDYAMAFSVFTHINLNMVRRCLSRLAPRMQPGGKFLATYFEAPADPEIPFSDPHCERVTYSHHDPFHYSFEDMEYVVRHLPWRVRDVGPWLQDAEQQMLIFERTPSAEMG
ncbi:MAG: class I SAM-dependent methyltransferase [Alphaproteobacteria bacterium]